MLSLLLFLLLYFPLCTTIDLGVTKGGRWWLALLSSFRLEGMKGGMFMVTFEVLIAYTVMIATIVKVVYDIASKR